MCLVHGTVDKRGKAGGTKKGVFLSQRKQSARANLSPCDLAYPQLLISYAADALTPMFHSTPKCQFALFFRVLGKLLLFYPH